MSAAFDTPSTESRNTNKPLWIAVGVLGAAVLAMGGTLAYKELRPQPAMVAESAISPNPNETPMITEKAEVASVEATPVAPKIVATPAPRVVPKVVHPHPPAPVYQGQQNRDPAYPTGNVGTPNAPSYPVAVAQRPICQNCGSIESVTPIQRNGPTNGVGAVTGGVLGAIVGNQVGHGNGRAAATVLGALGGGFAGNAVEKNVKKVTVYQVRVRMEDGSVRTIEQSAPASVGARVTVDGNTLRSSDGVSYAPQPQPARNEPVYSNRAY